MEQDPSLIMDACEALQRKVGHLKCPMCGASQPEAHFNIGILQNSAFQTFAPICPKCGYLFQFDLRKLLAE